MQRREVWGTAALAEYLSAAEQKYTAESKVADLMTLQQFLRDRVAIETALVDNYGSHDAPDVSPAVDEGQFGTDDRTKARDALLQSILQRETVVKKVIALFIEENSKLPQHEQFSIPRREEIRQKLRERSGAPAALAAGVATPNPETWHARKGALQQLIEKRQNLIAKLDAARANLLQIRREQPERAVSDDTTVSLLSSDVAPSTDLTPVNFDTYDASHLSQLADITILHFTHNAPQLLR
jgi:hypothetical protein